MLRLAGISNALSTSEQIICAGPALLDVSFVYFIHSVSYMVDLSKFTCIEVHDGAQKYSVLDVHS